MRDLTKKQKTILEKWYIENKENIQAGIAFFEWNDCNLFPLKLYEKLQQINDTEILDRNINAYIQKLAGY